MNGIRESQLEAQFQRYYDSVTGDDFEKTCAALLLIALDADIVRTVASVHPQEQQETFWMAYECFLICVILLTVKWPRTQTADPSALARNLRDNIRSFAHYEAGVFEEIWDAVQGEFPKALSPGLQGGPPSPWTRIAMACNTVGFDLGVSGSMNWYFHVLEQFMGFEEVLGSNDASGGLVSRADGLLRVVSGYRRVSKIVFQGQAVDDCRAPMMQTRKLTAAENADRMRAAGIQQSRLSTPPNPAQSSVGGVPSKDSFARLRDAQEFGPIIYVPPGTGVAGETVGVAPQEQSKPVPAYPPVWSQAHTLPQIVTEPTPALESGDWPWRRVARWMYNWRSWLAFVLVFSILSDLSALGEFRMICAANASRIPESAVILFWFVMACVIGFNVAIVYGYVKLFTEPNRAGQVIMWSHLAYAMLGVIYIGIGMLGLDSKSSLARGLQLWGGVALAWGLLMARLSAPLIGVQFARLAQVLDDLRRHGVPHSFMPKHGGGRQCGRYVVNPNEPRDWLSLWKIVRQVVTGKIVLPDAAD